MNYIVLDIEINKGLPYVLDILSQELADSGFESFEQSDNTLHAYVSEENFNEGMVNAILCRQQVKATTRRSLVQQNWNLLWESNYKPVVIDEAVYIRASFHQPQPNYAVELVIDPKMAFGTGHHPTTCLMIRSMLQVSFQNLVVLDMGCGSGILSVLAEKLGACSITAADTDPLCLASTAANGSINNCTKIKVVQAPITGAEIHEPERRYNVILANINKGVLLENFIKFSSLIAPGGILFISGFYEADLLQLKDCGHKNKFVFISSDRQGDWVTASFKR